MAKPIEFIKNNIIGRTWLRILSFCCVPLFIFVCLLEMEYLNYRSMSAVFEHWDKQPLLLLFSAIVLILLSAVILLLVRKLWIYGTVFGVLTVVMGIVNCVKTAANGDNFVPWDITMIGNMDQLVGFAHFDLPKYTFPLIIIIALFCVLFALSKAEIPLKWYFRIPGAAVICIAFTVLYNFPKTTEALLKKFTMSFNDSILQSSNYSKNGFTNAFTLNCFALKVVEPEGYSEQKIAEYIGGYIDKELDSAVIAESSSTPDVIVILSEAFFDVRTLNGTEFSQNPLENFDEICARENAYSGTMYTTAFGGGTVRTEFEVLTGLTVDYLVNGTSPYLYVTDELESYVSTYKAQGYNTTAIHPYDHTFYMRDDAYPYLGFDEFISEDQIKERDDVTRRRGFITDDTFVNVIIDTLESKTDASNFVFGISMENHGAYDRSDPSEIVIDVKNDNLSTEMLDCVTTYTQGVYYTDQALKKLVDYIDSRDKDTVLVFFGDHLPTLGASQAAYNQAGNVKISDGYDQEECEFLFGPPFLCYANFDSIDYAVFKESHDISCYYLMSFIAKATDTYMTPYMNYLLDIFELVPYYNVRLKMTLSDNEADFINSMKLITYDRIKGKRYSVIKWNE